MAFATMGFATGGGTAATGLTVTLALGATGLAATTALGGVATMVGRGGVTGLGVATGAVFRETRPSFATRWAVDSTAI
jgi:hypothetical protein